MRTAIRTRGLTRSFGSLVAVDHLDLEVPRGVVIGLVGPNGAGKSTIIRMLLGLIAPTAGTGEVLGHPISNPKRYADRVGALIEDPAFVPSLSARANVESMAILREAPKSRAEQVLETVGLIDRAGDRVSEYSLGMKQRLGIAISLVPDPELLILDEPTNGLDPAGIVEVRQLLRRLGDEGRTVVVSSHLLSEIEAAADFLVVIRGGGLLYAGPLVGLLEQERRYVELEPEIDSVVPQLTNLYRSHGYDVAVDAETLHVAADPVEAANLNRLAIREDIVLRRLVPHAETLEDVFLRMTEKEVV